MALKPPNWCKDAVMTRKGWKHPDRNEILLRKKFTQAQVDEWNGVTPSTAVEEVEEVLEPDIDDVTELLDEEWTQKSEEFNSMTKDELEAYGREHGIELDKRRVKADMILNLVNHLNSSSFDEDDVEAE